MDEEIVIVSNDAQGRAAFGIALSDQGCHAQICSTTTEAAALVANPEVGVLLVDCVSIPVADGLQLARDCRAQRAQLRCLVICDARESAECDQIIARTREIDPVNDWLHVLPRPYSMVRFATKMKEMIVQSSDQ